MKVCIDCGHGGLLNGVYQCIAKGKQYTFADGLKVLEGVVNREIAIKLIGKLKTAGISYIDLNSSDPLDAPLLKRTMVINKHYATNKDLWLLSIHSNAASIELTGEGSQPNGCEIFISDTASVKSKEIQTIAEKQYKADGHKWRGSKTANFWMLRESKCPALLVENYFYTNRKDAEFLLSDAGQNKIAETLFKIVKQVV